MARITSVIAPLYFHRPSEEVITAVFGDVRCSANAFNRAFFDCVQKLKLAGELGALEMPGPPISTGERGFGSRLALCLWLPTFELRLELARSPELDVVTVSDLLVLE